jgi:hypothetical protein
MAKVWPVYDGSPSRLGGPWAELALDDAIRILDLEPGGILTDLSGTPKFEDSARSLTLAGLPARCC